MKDKLKIPSIWLNGCADKARKNADRIAMEEGLKSSKYIYSGIEKLNYDGETWFGEFVYRLVEVN